MSQNMKNFMRIERENLNAVTGHKQTFNREMTPTAKNALLVSREISREPELANTPEVRADVVARGKALVADPNYPSKETLQRVAGVLAADLKRDRLATPSVVVAV